jgi:hypothetical protein
MKSNFTNDDFEQFLKQSADSCRMRPSDEVWKGVSKHLNERKRRVRYATGAFLVAASLLGFFLADSSKDINRSIASASAEVNNTNTHSSKESTTLKELVNSPVVKAPEQNSAVIRTIPSFRKVTPTTEGTFTDGLHASTSLSSNNNNPAESVLKQQAPIIPLFKELNLATYPLKEQLAAVQTTIEPASVHLDNDLSHTHAPEEAKTEESAEEKEERQLLSIESVTNVFKAIRNRNRVTFQFFFTPTVSYRKLTENKDYLRASQNNPNAAPNMANFYSVNNAVTHKPDIGLELGFAAKYPVAKNVKVRGGLQFNMNRYDIKAFNYTPEVATIALNTGNNQVDYLGSVTSYRNFGGNSSDWLQNLYFQLSAPVGVEVNLPSKKNVRFGVASTLQPTYVVGERAYLISSDYKNYTEVPWLTRKWNVATNLETFVSYSTGKMQWQVGPQVRYQLLSSFNSKYPVKENLFDFGLKVGVSLNK